MAKIESWNPESGFGFTRVDGRRVFVHCSVVSPRPARGADLTGREVVVEGVEWGAEKGPRAVSVLTVEEYERREAEKAKAAEGAAYWPSQEVSADLLAPGFVVKGEVVPFLTAQEKGAPVKLVQELIAQHQKLLREKYGPEAVGLFYYSSEYWDKKRFEEFLAGRALKKKFEKVRAAYPLSSVGDGLPLEWERVVAVDLPAEVAQVVVESHTWDNDAKEISDRPGARSLEVFHASYEWVEHQQVSKGSGPTLVRLQAKVTSGKSVSSYSKGSFGTDIEVTIYEAVPADVVMKSDYHVSLEGAQMLWAQYCQWYRNSRRDLEAARHQAQLILGTRRIWAEEFSGIEPGDWAGAIKSLGLDPYTTSIAGWVNGAEWHVPPFLLMKEEEFWAERERRLLEEAQAGDERARETLAEELEERFFGELVEKLCQVTGLTWDWNNWWTSSIETTEKTIPVWSAFVGETEVCWTRVWYTKRGGYPYYRLFSKEIQMPAGYKPGSLEWRVVEQASATQE